MKIPRKKAIYTEIYGPIGSGTFLSGSPKNNGNIGLLKSKPNHKKGVITTVLCLKTDKELHTRDPITI